MLEDLGIDDFLLSLRHLFPESSREIRLIERRIRSSTRMAGIFNQVSNPFSKDIFDDKRFFLKEFLPLMPGFLYAVARTSLADESIEKALASISANRSLNDMISLHFFKGTPASFAFGYFENFQDYKYPLGGTGRLPESLARKIRAEGLRPRVRLSIEKEKRKYSSAKTGGSVFTLFLAVDEAPGAFHLHPTHRDSYP